MPEAARAGQGFRFVVDGVEVAAEPHGPVARLRSTLAPALPDDEGAARALLAAFLPYVDAGPEALCADAAGRVLLIADLEPDAEAETALARFADAAVHWSRRLARAAAPVPVRPLAPGPVMIFP